MREITPVEEKQLLLEMLAHIDKVCRANDIEYSVSGGTLLGAIRHQGFIPWDDDIDVMLTRANYERLQEALVDESDKRYYLLTEKTPGYYYCFSKICDSRTKLITEVPQDARIDEIGVYIDIFPIDQLPDPGAELNQFLSDILKLRRHLFWSIPGFYHYSKNWWRSFVKAVVFFYRFVWARVGGTPEQWFQKTYAALQTYTGTDAGMAGFILSEYGTKEVLPLSVFESYTDVVFENLTVRSIDQYTKYLKALYGDYMQLPPVEKRRAKHPYKQLWKD